MGHRILDNLSQRRFGKLTVIEPVATDGAGRRSWLCSCDCGARIRAFTGSLLDGRRTCCGCAKPKRQSVSRAARDPFGGKCCIKGCDGDVQGHNLCRPHYQAWRQNGHPLHFFGRRSPILKGKSASKEYKTWHSAKRRCTKVAAPSYPNYGGRGIRMCARWMESFDNFLEDMGAAPTRDHSLDRVDVNGNYEPSNCRWATASQQSRNTRSVRLSADIVATAKGRWESGEAPHRIARDMGVPYSALQQAIRGKSWADIHARRAS